MSKRPIKLATSKEKKKYSEFLARGEEVVAVYSIGDKYFWLNVFSFGLLSLLIVGLPFLLKLIHLRHRRQYILTDRRVLVKDGLFSIKTTSAPYDKITHISVRQDFLNKLSYNIGDITLHTAAAGSAPVEIDLVKIENPMQVKNLIEELIIKERSLLGVVKERESIVHPLS